MRLDLIARCCTGVAALALIAGSQIGCANDRPSTDLSEDEATSGTSGLWVLDGEAAVGDLELLQLTARGFAAILRDEAVMPAPAANAATNADVHTASGAGRAPSAASSTPPEAATQLASGHVTRVTGSPEEAPSLSLSIVSDGDATRYKVTSTPDTLTLTAADGRQLHYRRSFSLYCVPANPGNEATMLIEMTKDPKVVGVNGDGHRFPAAGDYKARVRTDMLFDAETYVIESSMTTNQVTSDIKVTLPWAEMTKPQMHGEIAITGTTDNVAPTPITCERINTPAPPPPAAPPSPSGSAPQR